MCLKTTMTMKTMMQKLEILSILKQQTWPVVLSVLFIIHISLAFEDHSHSELGLAGSLNNDGPVVHRQPRQTEELHEDELGSGSAEGEDGSGKHDHKEGGGSGLSLGKILGFVFLVCCILYCIGIGWKIFKVFKGTYVEEEPVFLKYK